MKSLKLITFIFMVVVSSFTSTVQCEWLGYNSWQPLVPGDTIYIIAPSNGFPDEESLFTTLTFLREFLLSQYGLKIKYDGTAFAKKDPLCPEKAMSTQAAFSDLKAAFNDPEVKAIWALRGGRLSHEMWSLLEAEAKSFPRKPLLGFSDITSMHLFLNNLGFATIHCPVLFSFKESPAPMVNKLTSLTSTVDILMGRTPMVTYKGFIPHNKSAQEAEETIFMGRVLGGNLSSLHYYDSVYGAGTSQEPAIWMIETFDDYTRIDSILEAINRGRILKNAQAIVFGLLHNLSYSDPKFSAVQKRCELIIKKFAQKTNIPVFSVMANDDDSCFCFGHGDRNHPFPLGTFGILAVGAQNEPTSLMISAS